jgi:hypothetical protein
LGSANWSIFAVFIPVTFSDLPGHVPLFLEVLRGSSLFEDHVHHMMAISFDTLVQSIAKALLYFLQQFWRNVGYLKAKVKTLNKKGSRVLDFP